MTDYKIYLISTSIIQDDVVNDFKNELPETIEVATRLKTNFSNASGGTTGLIISLITAASEGFFTGLGEYSFTIIVDKIEAFIKSSSSKKNDSRANFEIDLSEGERKRIFKASNVSDSTVQNALKNFKEIAKKNSESNTYNFINNEWKIEDPEEIKKGLEKIRNEMMEKLKN